MNHVPRLQAIGLDDDSPYLTIRQVCSCGAVITEHQFDSREEGIEERIGEQAVADAREFERHEKEAS